jgi:hypothetical protein
MKIDYNNLLDNQDFLDSQLKDLQIVMVYLLSTGRNAWHSTWSEKYRRDNALFSSFEDAKKAAENLRNRGTKFEIEQYPGIALFSPKGIVVFLEFHSKLSFSQLQIDELEKSIKLDSPISVAMSPFIKPSITYWTPPFPSQSSFVHKTWDLAESFEPFPQDFRLKRWGSQAIGSNYYLVWHETNFESTSPVWNVFRSFHTQEDLMFSFSPDEVLEQAKERALVDRQVERDMKAKQAAANRKMIDLLMAEKEEIDE